MTRRSCSSPPRQHPGSEASGLPRGSRRMAPIWRVDRGRKRDPATVAAAETLAESLVVCPCKVGANARRPDRRAHEGIPTGQVDADEADELGPAPIGVESTHRARTTPSTPHAATARAAATTRAIDGLRRRDTATEERDLGTIEAAWVSAPECPATPVVGRPSSPYGMRTAPGSRALATPDNPLPRITPSSERARGPLPTARRRNASRVNIHFHRLPTGCGKGSPASGRHATTAHHRGRHEKPRRCHAVPVAHPVDGPAQRWPGMLPVRYTCSEAPKRASGPRRFPARPSEAHGTSSTGWSAGAGSTRRRGRPCRRGG